MPAAVVLLKSKLELAVSFQIDERSFSVHRVKRIIEHVRLDVPIPLITFPGG